MSDKTWEAEYRRRLTEAVVLAGDAVGTDPDEYWWKAEDAAVLAEHLKACKPDYSRCTWADSQWREFAGSFARPEEEYHAGIELVMACSCGAIDGRQWRYEGSYPELLRIMTEEDGL